MSFRLIGPNFIFQEFFLVFMHVQDDDRLIRVMPEPLQVEACLRAIGAPYKHQIQSGDEEDEEDEEEQKVVVALFTRRRGRW